MRRTAAFTGLPVLITESGIATEDDTERIRYLDSVLHDVHHCMADGDRCPRLLRVEPPRQLRMEHGVWPQARSPCRGPEDIRPNGETQCGLVRGGRSVQPTGDRFELTLSRSWSQSSSPDDDDPVDLASLTRALESAGCVAAPEEATELIAAARDETELRRMRERRLSGEPLAWVTGRTVFCGLEIMVEPGVYVPRWQSEPLARQAARLLPDEGVAVDLCAGSGALAAVMQATRPAAEVVATEIDTAAVRCARQNGIRVYQGDLDLPLPATLAGRVDVMTGVLPYVPTNAMHLLPRDVRHFEPRLALDGGDAGLTLLSRAVQRAPGWLKKGGWLLVEVGGDQISPLTQLMADAGYEAMTVIQDEDGDPRGLCAQRCRGSEGRALRDGDGPVRTPPR